MPNHLDIVRNGTTSSIHDQQKAREYAEADKRRAELDRKRALAKQSPKEAKLYNHVLGGVGTHASIVVKLVHKDGSTLSWETCELSVDSDGLTLIVVCPRCLFTQGRRMEQSQLTLRSWHRKFSLDSFGQGVHWVNPVDGSFVTIAGTIETHDKQTCPDCHFAFHLEKSRDPTEKGLTVMREA